MRAIKQGLVSSGFLKLRTVAQSDFCAAFDLQFRHTERDSGIPRFFIYRNNFLQRRLAFQYSHSPRTQIWLGAQDCLYGKISNEDAAERHKSVIGRWQIQKQSHGFTRICTDLNLEKSEIMKMIRENPWPMFFQLASLVIGNFKSCATDLH